MSEFKPRGIALKRAPLKSIRHVRYQYVVYCNPYLLIWEISSKVELIQVWLAILLGSYILLHGALRLCDINSRGGGK